MRVLAVASLQRPYVKSNQIIVPQKVSLSVHVTISSALTLLCR
uniref:Uncharacterized protein n=1 Tax=Arundo donax TaxID=35708 RepID=A0A0A9EQM5_ARUDO